MAWYNADAAWRRPFTAHLIYIARIPNPLTDGWYNANAASPIIAFLGRSQQDEPAARRHLHHQPLHTQILGLSACPQVAGRARQTQPAAWTLTAPWRCRRPSGPRPSSTWPTTRYAPHAVCCAVQALPMCMQTCREPCCKVIAVCMGWLGRYLFRMCRLACCATYMLCHIHAVPHTLAYPSFTRLGCLHNTSRWCQIVHMPPGPSHPASEICHFR
jgi:hypothetical protein